MQKIYFLCYSLGIGKTVRKTNLWCPITVSSGLQVGVGVCGGVGGGMVEGEVRSKVKTATC